LIGRRPLCFRSRAEPIANGDREPLEFARLFRVACALIRQVNSEQTIIDHWTLGGGTAMMLQIALAL